MSFKKNKYVIIREAISKDLAIFVANYFSMRKHILSGKAFEHLNKIVNL